MGGGEVSMEAAMTPIAHSGQSNLMPANLFVFLGIVLMVESVTFALVAVAIAKVLHIA